MVISRSLWKSSTYSPGRKATEAHRAVPSWVNIGGPHTSGAEATDHETDEPKYKRSRVTGLLQGPESLAICCFYKCLRRTDMWATIHYATLPIF